MQRHSRGHGAPPRSRAAGRLRLPAFLVAVVALVVGGGIPAAAVDGTPPTLVTFSRDSAPTVSRGQALTLSWTATDDSSGVSSVVFHYTDPLGNDMPFTGTSGGPTSMSTTVGKWPNGNYRLDEIDVTDGAGNKSAYIAGVTTFNLDNANFSVTGNTAFAKPTIRGVLDRTALPTAQWQPVVNGYVLRADWSALQPVQGGDIAPNNAIDQAIAQLRTLNAQTRGTQPPTRLKLRVLAGDSAPDWAKNVGGPPVLVQDSASSGTYDTVGRFWTPAFGAAYQDFMTKLAARYDGVPEVRDVVVSRCTLTTAEPFLRMTSDSTSVQNLRNAGFNVADDHTCHQQQVDVHKAVWLLTSSSVAFTPYQQILPTSTNVDESWTEAMIDYCRQQMGSRCVLESNSIKDPSVPRGPSYGPMYAKIAATGPPIAYQTASPNNGLTSLCNTLGWAISQGTGAVELPQAYVRDGVSTPAGMASYDKALEGFQPADGDTPTVPSNFNGTVSGPSSVNLTWSPSSDSGYGVACYSVSRAGTFVGTTMNTSLTDAAATPWTPVTYTVTAVDGAGHTSGAASTTVSGTAPTTTTSSSTSSTTTTTSTSTTTTTRPPTTTTSTTRPPTTTSSTSTTSTTRPPTTTTSTTRPPTTTTSTTRPPTTTTTIKANPPSAPQNATLTSQCTGALLTWTPPASNGGAPITSYRVYRGAWGAETFLASTTGTSYNDTTGGTWTWNYYRVTAVNASNLEGPPSSDVGGYKTC
jgi:hypothetical protein